jgi:putative Mg2+ transporter-C (MgtC) family protein
MMAHEPGHLTHLVFAERVVLALFFGAIIGLERQFRQRMAGLRTNALVATGTALFVMVTPLLGNVAASNATQIAAYVVSGIGFLAGGVIFKERLSITGLNTAATMWCTAAVGVLVGFGFLAEAAVGVAAVLFANVVLRPIVQLVNRRPVAGSEVVTSYEVRATCGREVEDRVRATMIAAIRKAGMTLIAVYSDDAAGVERVEVVADVSVMGQDDARLETIIRAVGLVSHVSSASWKIVPTSDEERALLPDA